MADSSKIALNLTQSASKFVIETKTIDVTFVFAVTTFLRDVLVIQILHRQSFFGITRARNIFSRRECHWKYWRRRHSLAVIQSSSVFINEYQYSLNAMCGQMAQVSRWWI